MDAVIGVMYSSHTLMSVPSFTRIERGLGGTHDLKITKVHFFHSNTSEYNCFEV